MRGLYRHLGIMNGFLRLVQMKEKTPPKQEPQAGRKTNI